MIYRDPEPNRGIVVTIAVGLFALMGLVGAMDYEQEQADADHYCAMVAAGAWPDRPEYECDKGEAADAPQDPALAGGEINEPADPRPRGFGPRMDRQPTDEDTSELHTLRARKAAPRPAHPGRVFRNRRG